MSTHFLAEEMLAALLQHNPFVPPELIATFSRAFLRFFQGDFASAVYILTPLVENSLRHVLKMQGHDVTTFDDATQTQKSLTISQLFEQMRPTTAIGAFLPYRDRTGTAARGVRRERRRFPVGAGPTRRNAPAGSNRSSHGGDEMAEAFGVAGHI